MKNPFRTVIHFIIISVFLFGGFSSSAAGQQTAKYVLGQPLELFASEIDESRQRIDSLMQAQNIPGVQVGRLG